MEAALVFKHHCYHLKEIPNLVHCALHQIGFKRFGEMPKKIHLHGRSSTAAPHTWPACALSKHYVFKQHISYLHDKKCIYKVGLMGGWIFHEFLRFSLRVANDDLARCI